MEALKRNIEKEYGEAAERWGVKTDSRKYFSNKYYQIMNALNSLENVTDSYVHCAVYEQIDKDTKEMEVIFKRYTEMEELAKRYMEVGEKELQEIYKRRDGEMNE